MIKMSESLVRKIAQLSHFQLAPEEVKVLENQFEKILNYIEKLQEVDVNGVEPLYYPHEVIESYLREDQAFSDPNLVSKLLKLGPSGTGFKVPPIL